jgi:hypothetical protein|tara:strand:+ start:900 stop:1289 length:390 start_codon:yes stop_codon:yes gene_type:complete
MTKASKSYKKMQGYDIYRYAGNSRKKDDVCVVLGSVVKMKNPENKGANADYVGKEGMYFIITYRWSRNQWVYGSVFRNFWQTSANKIVKYGQGLAKTVYYIPYGNLSTMGKLVRDDFFIRPPTKFKGKK